MACTRLPPVFEQGEGDADLAVAFGFGALTLERTFSAVEAFIVAPVAVVAIVRGVTGSILEI